MEKINTAPAQGGIQNVARNHSIGFTTARQYRVMRALMQGPQSREAIDRIAGASNGPAVIQQLRILGYEIPCTRVSHKDRDGLAGWHGVYSLSPQDRLRLREWLSCRGVQL